MAETTKTDNANLPAKLALRRHYLRKYHAQDERIRVFECCQGEGVIWKHLADEFPVDVWGVDVKPKKGRLKIDSVRVLQQPGLNRDVIDIDTYGSPWQHWFALLPNITRPTTVFLTLGLVKIGGGSLDRHSIRCLGLAGLRSLPGALAAKIAESAPSYVLSRSADAGIMLIEVSEVESDGNARYFGVRIEPRKPVVAGGS